MSLEQHIQKWVAVDNQVHTMNEKLKTLRVDKKESEEQIFKYVETKGLNNATIKISDGTLKFVSTRQVAPLTIKFVEECLLKCIKNTEQVERIMDFIKESREIKYTPDIKRVYAS